MSEFRVAECGSREQWNEFVRIHGTVHHLFDWAEVNRLAFRCRCVNLACYDGNEIAAVYPYVVRGRWPIRWFDSPNDFGGGPVGDSEGVTLLVEEVDRRARKAKAGTNTARFGGETVPSEFARLGYSVCQRMDLVIDIARSRERLWASFSKNLRKAIRKAETQGIEMREAAAGDLDDFLRLAGYHRRTVGYRGRSSRWINALVECLDTRLHLVHWDGHLVGGCLYLTYRGRCFGVYATRDPDRSDLRIGQAIHWGGIKRFQKEGFTHYDWLSRNDNEVHRGETVVHSSLASLHRFKTAWRPQEIPNYDAVKTFSKRTARLRTAAAGARNVAQSATRKLRKAATSK